MTAARAEELAGLARRLAPDVLREAVAEARELARRQIAERLAAEILHAAMEDGADVSLQAGAASGPQETASPAGAPPETGPREAGPDRPGAAGAAPQAGPAAVALAEAAAEGGAAWAGATADSGLYAYGIVPADLDTTGIQGLDGDAPVRVIPRGRVALAVSDIELALLANIELADLEGELSETGLLARLARQHDQVLRALLDRGGVLPLRFGTVLPDEDAARAVLDDSDGGLSGLLAEVAGAREWGLRADLAAEPAAESAGESAGEAEAAGTAEAPAGTAGESPADGEPASGTAYLTARRAALRAETERRRRFAAVLDSVDAELCAHARDAVRRSGGPPERVLDCAYLVPIPAEEEFLAVAGRAAEELESAGCVAQVTGPWPPYSFAHITLGGGPLGGDAPGGQPLGGGGYLGGGDV